MKKTIGPVVRRVWFGVAVAFWLVVWQLASMAIDQEILLVSPLRAIQTLVSLLGESAFHRAVIGSLLRIMTGFAMGLAAGILLALAARFALPVRMLLMPVMSAIKATPVASFVILALIWIPSKNLSVFMALLIVLPVIYSNVLEGLDRADVKLIEMAAVFGMSFPKRLRSIFIPSALPYLLASVRLSLGMCWKAGIAAEVIGQPRNSIGSALYQAKIFLATPELFAWTLAIIILSVLIEKAALMLIKLISRRLDYGD